VPVDPSAAPCFALTRDRVVQILAATGDDLDLRRDQLTGDRFEQRRIARRCRSAQLLEARDQLERLGIEDRELLLDSNRQVRGPREDLLDRL